MYQKVCTERASETVAYRVDLLLAKVVSFKKKASPFSANSSLSLISVQMCCIYVEGTGTFVLCPILFDRIVTTCNLYACMYI